MCIKLVQFLLQQFKGLGHQQKQHQQIKDGHVSIFQLVKPKDGSKFFEGENFVTPIA